MKTVVIDVACLLMTTALTNAQVLFAPVFGATPFFGPRFGPPPFGGPPPFFGGPPPFFGGPPPFGGPAPPRFGPAFGQGRGLGYIGALGLLAAGGPIGALVGAAGLSGFLADDLTRL